ncbi:HAD-superfamily phosphatase [Rhizopus microsporus ATCC 52813]|uniref:HAD-superfamily phosphatase n=1 Tax=Rhizopus microsporus ATCC 52813 TaxID=1340429 RepID=A0A2G4SXW1_RHIZD|nr:HAD-superfamily phosphatase [Rhizopus microsporus ATCC 52813]PHZ13584.1 HAD-superfamily phosphatase [Rhizopus microsporus ATCC 52813]
MVQSLNVSGIVNAFKLLWNPSLAMPHIIVKDMSCINYAALKKQANIQAIGFDKDNCLTAPYVSNIHPPFENAWEECKKTFGRDKVMIVSNSAGTKDDVGHKDETINISIIQAQHLEASLGVTVLRHEEKKPDGGHHLADYVKPIKPEQVAFVGDRILTDVLFGNRNGNLTIWTSQVITEEGDNKPALLVIKTHCHLKNKKRLTIVFRFEDWNTT